MKKLKFTSLTATNMGFTIVELMITVAILAIAIAIAAPNFSTFLTGTRVDNEISELNRLILTARNTAINTGQYVTVCPLGSDKKCGNDWSKEISVFTNSANTAANSVVYDSDDDERIVKMKSDIPSGDTTKSSSSSVIYSPTGRLVGDKEVSINYCPGNNSSLSRGLTVSASGRVYTSQDSDNDGKDENRLGTEINCS